MTVRHVHSRVWVYWILVLVAYVALTAEPLVDSASVVVSEREPQTAPQVTPAKSVVKRKSQRVVRVPVNSATVKELQRIPGIGEVLAERIVVSRENFGPFRSVQDLQRVKGIGKKRCETLSHHVIID